MLYDLFQPIYTVHINPGKAPGIVGAAECRKRDVFVDELLNARIVVVRVSEHESGHLAATI